MAQVFAAYLARMESCKPNTLRTRRIALHAFRDEARVGSLPWDALAESHLAAWLRTKPDWSPSYRRSTVNHVQAAYNHCIAHEPDSGVTANPLANMPKPARRRRKALIAPTDMSALMAEAKGSFRTILTMLTETGARPNELCTAHIHHFHGNALVLQEHKEDDRGEDRIIYLSTIAQELVKRAIDDRAEGPIFLNSRGEPWTPDTLYCRFKRLRKKLGLGPGVFPYAVRGRFTSDAINDSNMNPALVAKQLGHANLQVLLKHYLRENPQTMQSALDDLTRRKD